MTIAQNFIQELLGRVDVVDVVGRYVALKKSGANFMGLCPFHGEKSPSFSVSPSKQFYHCFGCGVSGDAIGFLMEHGGLSFVEAVNELAQQTGLVVPQQEGVLPHEREQAARVRHKQLTLYEVLDKAAQGYGRHLRTAPRAVAYLKGRGLSGEVAKRFGLGYAPQGWRALAGVFANYADPLLVESGLVIEQAGAQEAGPGSLRRYDRFRDRVMFPIRNVKGECVGFGGRVLDGGEPKYLNSPETAVFSKGRELYGLFEARAAIRLAGYALVTEGYMDVVSLAQLGFANAVATLGTACTPEQVQKLFRFTDGVVFSFDGDAAGRRAARKAMEAALPLATDTRSVKFLFLPAEHDPDSFVRAQGAAAFAQCVQEAMPLSRFLVQAASADCDLTAAEGRARMASQAKVLWMALPDGVIKRQLLAEIAGQAGLGAQDLLQLWQAGSSALQQQPSRAAGMGAEAAAPLAYGVGAGREPLQVQRPVVEARQWGAGPPHGWRRRGDRGGRELVPARMLGLAGAATSRGDRVVGLLWSNAQAWERLSAEDHALLASLPGSQGAALACLEAQVYEHGPVPWAVLRQALRGHALEAYVCAQVQQVAQFGDEAGELSELRSIMDLLRADALRAQAQHLALRVQQGDQSAYADFKRVTDCIRALKK